MGKSGFKGNENKTVFHFLALLIISYFALNEENLVEISLKTHFSTASLNEFLGGTQSITK